MEELIIYGTILGIVLILGIIWGYSKNEKLSRFIKKILDFITDFFHI